MTENHQDQDEPWFEIERRLRDDAEGRERDALEQRLEEAARAVKRRMDVGVSPAEFSGLQAIHQGLEAGIDVMQRVWRVHHPLA
ncbi:EscE/YscE/SsaE family type III secretion system needle protein co-chaperone [Allochromatium palmeri]|uniref:EscE/YscE/SsaE family type III secretion system needle protein co-chaperone n=1 Tax=Allochromatium palmeri TaxID=231048 RepID=A0A6N8EE31_9GAMM|nr:EscE/YscE/SsaE family type III secretion system needle protein co-chaperone [Allochromatium palmeri]MTW22493.1 hypothetical protein [Allochromatium palmeri]